MDALERRCGAIMPITRTLSGAAYVDPLPFELSVNSESFEGQRHTVKFLMLCEVSGTTLRETNVTRDAQARTPWT